VLSYTEILITLFSFIIKHISYNYDIKNSIHTSILSYSYLFQDLSFLQLTIIAQ